MARALRWTGVTISGLVRDAIRAEYDRRIGRQITRHRVRRSCPRSTRRTPTNRTSRRASYDAHATRRAIVTKLKRSAR